MKKPCTIRGRECGDLALEAGCKRDNTKLDALELSSLIFVVLALAFSVSVFWQLR